MPDTPEQATVPAPVAAAPVAQDPSSPTPPAAQPVPAPSAPVPSQGATPWDADLAAIFPDEATRSSVSDYLRTKVQPHVTKLEQSAKPAAEASEFLEDFRAKPDQTFIEVAEELYGSDQAKAIRDYLAATGVEVDEPEAQPDPAGEYPALPPEVQALVAWKQEQDEAAAYNSEFARVKEANPDIALDPDLLKPFVANTGDFDQAVAQYRSFVTQLAASNAPTPAPGTTPPLTPAPPTLGSGTADGAGTTPTQPEHETLEEALTGFFDDLAAQGKNPQLPAPPVVAA